MTEKSPIGEFDGDYAREQLRRSQHPFRRLVKHFYLNHVLADVRGPTIDLGCGAGQLLARLPPGSLGLEVSPLLVETLRARGLNVLLYEPHEFSLQGLRENHYRTLVMSHVLEHFMDAGRALQRVLQACQRLGVERVILVLPGLKGFRTDPTHKTFVNRQYLREHGLVRCEGYVVTKSRYFPLNVETVGNHFAYHEFKVIYDRMAAMEAVPTSP